MALKEALKGSRKPPNLRRGTARANCGQCKHFRSNHRAGTCALYRYPVQSSQVSDSFAPKGESDQGGTPWQKAA